MQTIKMEQEQKLQALLTTVFLLLLFFASLKLIKFGVTKFDQTILTREIDLKMYEEKVEKVEKTVEEEDMMKPEDVVSEVSSIEDVVDEMALDKEMPSFEDMLKSLPEDELAIPDEYQPTDINEAPGDVFDPGLPEIYSGSGDIAIPRGDWGDVGGGEGGLSILKGGRKVGGATAKPFVPRRYTPLQRKNGDVNIAKIKATNKGINDWSAPTHIPKIKKWIDRHREELPRLIQLQLQYGPTDLTSMDRFELNGTVYDIFLLYRKGEGELRICLIQGDQVVLLIDSGISGRTSNYLEIGKIYFKKNGEMHHFEMARLSAADPRANKFYNVFLSWLDSIEKK